MTTRGFSILGVVAGVVALGIMGVLAVGYLRDTPLPPPIVEQPREVRWLIAQGQDVDASRAAAIFSDILSKETDGSLILRIVHPADIAVVENDVSTERLMGLMQQGSIEVTTIRTGALGYVRPTFWALMMPFMFTNYTTALRALDSDITTRIFTTLDDSPVRALALTLGDGFRIIATKSIAVRSTRDLVGTRIMTSGGPVSDATLAALGVQSVTLSTSTDEVTNLGSVDGVETTYSRYQAVGFSTTTLRVINETQHSLAASVLVVSSDFFATLRPVQQEALKKAAKAAALAESEDVMNSASSTRAMLQAQGVTIVEVPLKLRTIMRDMTAGVAAAFASTTDPAVIVGLSAFRQ